MNTSIAIYESKNSTNVVVFCNSVNDLLKYCSEMQAKNIYKAANDGRLYGAYFTKNGKVRATYNW